MATAQQPILQGSAFDCPHCGAYAHMHWFDLAYRQGGGFTTSTAVMAICSHCKAPSYWLRTHGVVGGGQMLHPNARVAPLPHVQMPVDVRLDYEEARDIAQQSPRAAAALLRLCVQKLCVYLGEPGKNINADIQALVAKGLPEQVQQALDVVRVVGNHSVHPGQMSGDDIAGVCNSLFDLVNYIVEDRIARPAQVQALYDGIPQNLRDAISKRDGNP